MYKTMVKCSQPWLVKKGKFEIMFQLWYYSCYYYKYIVTSLPLNRQIILVDILRVV